MSRTYYLIPKYIQEQDAGALRERLKILEDDKKAQDILIQRLQNELSVQSPFNFKIDNNDLLLRLATSDETINQLQNTLKSMKEEMERDKRTIGDLQAERAMMEGMYVVGSPVLLCVEKFRDLRDNTLTNLLFSITDDDHLQDELLPQIAFHDFWTIQREEDSSKELNPQERKELAQKIIKGESLNQASTKLVKRAEQVVRQIIKEKEKEGDTMGDERKKREMEEFYEQVAVVVAQMEMCYPSLEFLPRRVPKKGTLLNNIFGQPFDCDFGGYPVLESVDLPGLAARDLNNTIFCKASLKFKFPKKQTS